MTPPNVHALIPDVPVTEMAMTSRRKPTAESHDASHVTRGEVSRAWKVAVLVAAAVLAYAELRIANATLHSKVESLEKVYQLLADFLRERDRDRRESPR
jgi:hypothetical protein